YSFFFFQAEDGIRDLIVTGVQTCALPISMWGFFQNRGYYQFTNGFTTQTATNDGTGSALASLLLGLPVVKQRQAGIPQMDLRTRSEERRVGKECRDRWAEEQ